MTTTAQSVIRAVQEILVDETGVRHDAVKLARDLNDLQRAIHSVRPDSTATNVDLPGVNGHEQTIPATAAALMEITHRLEDNRAVRQTTRELLDAVAPEWRTLTPTRSTVHWMVDPRLPRKFEVYPPYTITGGANGWRGVISAYPTDVPVPAGPSWTDVTGNISLADEFKNALIHLVVWRQYLVAAEFANDPAIAQAHLDIALRDIGESLLAKLSMKPGVAADSSATEPQ